MYFVSRMYEMLTDVLWCVEFRNMPGNPYTTPPG